MQADDLMRNTLVHNFFARPSVFGGFGSFILECDYCFHTDQNDPHQVKKQPRIQFWLPKHAEPI